MSDRSRFITISIVIIVALILLAVFLMYSGKPRFITVVIPPGLRKEEIGNILADKLKWTDEQRQSFMNASTSTDFAEGVYFPDTYLIPPDEAATTTAARLLGNFNVKFAPYQKAALEANIKWTTLLTMASLIQREAAGTSDMALISGILWNRIEEGMPLGVDSTIQYIRGDAGSGWWAPISVADKKIDSLYNTYMNKGLPPHPIDNPGLDAIKAALEPEKTDCLYYLHDNSRNIHCAKTYEEHQNNIEEWLK